MQISFSGSLTEKQLRRAMSRQMLMLKLLGMVMTIASIVLAIAWATQDPHRPADLFLSAVAGILGLLMYLLPAISAKRQFKTNKLLRDDITGSATDACITMNGPHGTANIPWDCFHKAVVARDIVLLFQSGSAFNLIPQGFFTSEGDWHSFQDLARSKVKQRRNIVAYIAIAWLAVVAVVLIVLNHLPKR